LVFSFGNAEEVIAAHSVLMLYRLLWFNEVIGRALG